jgi:hypothetical protein
MVTVLRKEIINERTVPNVETVPNSKMLKRASFRQFNLVERIVDVGQLVFQLIFSRQASLFSCARSFSFLKLRSFSFLSVSFQTRAATATLVHVAVVNRVPPP